MNTFVNRLSLCLVLLLAMTTAARAADDILIADFEGQSYGKWEATGEAFGEEPAGGALQGQQQVTGFKGQGLVNTFRNRDGSTGTLTSPAFTIQRKYITFLIGGGMHDDTCMQLLVDGEVVGTRSGQNDERLTPAFFDVAEHKGKTARLRIVDQNTGGWGHVNVDHIVQTDTKPDVPSFGPQERTFTVRQKYLVIPIKNGAKSCQLSLKVNGEEVRRYDTELATDPDDVDWWAFFTIEDYKGKPAEVSANPATKEGFALVRQADKVPGSEDWYTESLRPQLRFSQKVGWNNDPNGMVYYDGEWHLFFQHNPVGWKWGNMTWGHAVSKDLVHWEQLPNVLFPSTMAKGACFSGGGTVDPKNTAGFKTGSEDVIVAFLTDTGAGEALAYSNDRGRNFTWYEGNPVVRHRGRDPKVIWYAYDSEDQPLSDKAKQLGGHWVMAVYDEHPDHGRNIAFYTSTNLKDWTLQSHLSGFFECPELFELPVDGKADNTKWVTYAADGKYVIGSFDGRTFTPDHQGKHTVFYGNYYAAQTFDNAPDGRRIQIGWARMNFPGMPFNQTFSFPHRLTLRNTSDGVRMFAEPVKEIEILHKKTHTASNKSIAPNQPVSLNVSGELFHICATFEIGDAEQVGLDIDGERIVYDTKANKLDQANFKPIDGKVTIEVIVDRPLLEIIGNDGRVFITRPRGNKGEVDTINAFAEGGEATLIDLKVHELKSIWKKPGARRSENPAQHTRTAALFEDSFEGRLDADWFWLREDTKAWRFADGGLEIRVQPGVASNVKNALVRKAPDRGAGPYAVEATLTNLAAPTDQYEQAGITFYHDGKPVIKLVKELINGELYIIPGRQPMNAETVQLRLVISADSWTAQFRPDAKGEFQTAATGKLPAPGKDEVSIQCYNGPPDAEHWVRFDDFRIVSLRGAAAAQKKLTYADLVGRLNDLERLATPVKPGEKTFASTSHNRAMSYDPKTDTYKHWGANGDSSGCIRKEGDRLVMVDLKRPGVLWRTWSAEPLDGHIKIYIDGSDTPIIDKPFNDYFGDFEKKYPGLAMTLSRGRNEFIPISFAKSCKVVVDKGWGRFFHCTHTVFAEDTEVESFPGFTPEVDALLKKASEDWLKRGPNPHPDDPEAKRTTRTLAIGSGKSKDVSLPGAGAIRVLKVTPLEMPEDRIEREDVLRELTLSIHWDGEQTPSVWSPLGDFFATSPGINPYKTLPMGCIDGTFYSYWYMPYADGARLVVTNDGKAARKVAVELETVPLDRAEASRLLRFCAAWHSGDFTGLDSERFMKSGGDRWPDWPLLVVEGKGRYVGMTEHIWKFGGWWGEGDEKFFVDGEKYPSTVGTGSEDYIGYAWAANPPFITFDSALAAVSRIRPDAQEDTSVCRFHVCDDIPFSESFQGFIEVMPLPNCRPVLYDTCVYWYREDGARNPYPVVPPAERQHQRPSPQQRDAVPITILQPKSHAEAIEGENLKVLRIGSGRHWVQPLSNPPGQWSRGEHRIWTHGEQGDSIEFKFPVPEAGTYELFAVFTKAADYGIFQIAIDGKPAGKPIDLYDTKVTTSEEVSLGTRRFSKGLHTLKATAVGHNDNNVKGRGGRYLFGLDYMRLEKK